MSDPPPPPAAIPAEAILAQLPDAVVYSDTSGRIRLWNAAAEKLFGFSAPETLGQSLDIMIPERFRRAHRMAFERADEAGKADHEGEVRLTHGTHKDGSQPTIDRTFGKVTLAVGSVTRVTATAG